MTKLTKHQQLQSNLGLIKVGLLFACLPTRIVLKRMFQDVWNYFIKREQLFDVIITNKKGKQALDRMEKDGYINIKSQITFTDKAVKNMMASFDEKTGTMEITGRKKKK